MSEFIIQDGRDTHIVVYVNWGDEEIISEAEYEAKVEEEANGFAADDYQFGQWLNEHYNADEIWDMTEAEKEEVKADWLKYCREGAEDELSYERRVLI